jgi:hypothetical protein
MPLAAIQAGVADDVLPLEGIARYLAGVCAEGVSPR